MPRVVHYKARLLRSARVPYRLSSVCAWRATDPVIPDVGAAHRVDQHAALRTWYLKDNLTVHSGNIGSYVRGLWLALSAVDASCAIKRTVPPYGSKVGVEERQRRGLSLTAPRERHRSRNIDNEVLAGATGHIRAVRSYYQPPSSVRIIGIVWAAMRTESWSRDR